MAAFIAVHLRSRPQVSLPSTATPTTMKLISISSLALVALLLAAPCAAAAQTSGPQSDTPDIVLQGMSAYQKGDLHAALAVWLHGSPVENETTTERMVASLAPIEQAYGKMVGYDVLRVVDLGAAVRRVYAVIRFERGPLYAYFDCYQQASGNWVIPTLMANARASEILPADLLAGEH